MRADGVIALLGSRTLARMGAWSLWRVAALFAAIGPLACAALLDDDVPSPGAQPDGADASADGPSSGRVDGATDGGVPSDGTTADADTCTATGTLRMDDAFGQKAVPVANARTVVTRAGQIVTVGSATCADGGAQSVAVHAFDTNGAPGPPLRCLGSGTTSEFVHSFAYDDGLFVVATRLQTARGAAAVWAFGESGAPFHREERPVNGADPLFAHPAANVVWATVESNTPTLRYDKSAFKSRAIPAGTRPLTGASDGKHFYVVLYSAASGTLVVRRYELTSGAFALDTTFNPPDYSLAGVVGAEAALVGLGGALAEAGTLLVAVPVGAGAQAVISSDGGAWSTVTTVSGFSSRTLLARSCDGSLIVAMNGRVSRVVPGLPPQTLVLPLTQQLMSLAKDPAGRLVVQVSPATVMRVLP
jgi:hypothetical protein